MTLLNPFMSFPAAGGSYGDEVLADSPLAYWTLDDSSSPVSDESGNGITGAVTGATLSATGQVGTAASFDGSLDYIDCGTPSSVRSATVMTWEAWIKTSGSGNQCIISWDNSAPGERMRKFQFRTSSGVLQIIAFTSNSTLDSLSGSVTVNDNAWHHVAATFDGSDLTVYVDGSLDETKAFSGSLNTDAGGLPKLGIGARYSDSTAGTPWGNDEFNGTIDEPAIYGSALSAARIAAHYSAA